MGDDRFPTSNDPRDDYYGRPQSGDYGRDYGSGRDYGYSSAREYQAAGRLGGGDRDRDRERQRDWGGRDYGHDRYGQRERLGSQGYGAQSSRGFGDRSFNQQRDQGGGSEYHGSYAHDGRRFEDVGRFRHADDDNRRGGREQGRGYGQQAYGRQQQGHDDDDRGFFQRAGDEVRSWFGDEEAERRRDRDAHMDDPRYRQQGRDEHHHDRDYHAWRQGQIDAFDRDYQEYREENRQRFHTEFGAWRASRQSQRDSLSRVQEHQEVVGSDGEHVGTVDKVRGDRIILTKSDVDAGGRHHSIPSRWIQSVDTKVTLSKTAQEAKDHWRDEERNSAMFGQEQGQQQGQEQDPDEGRSGTNLNRSFSGTY